MSEDLLKTVRDLIASRKGDAKRLRVIIDTIKQGNPLLLSDYRYIQSLTSDDSEQQVVEDKYEDRSSKKEKPKPSDESLNLLRIRLAEGQITIDEFRELKKALTED
ncbi:MAG: hypothetical protein E6K98_06255 [Thaumarchaeota archaeon]|nr:MAG: hypothetical protein E6K98_06255 [Nitrososphaerota archaeon]TLX94392.1 MAG: hypothetical protein E6K91_06765 [Nitrososphaerota archaeon]